MVLTADNPLALENFQLAEPRVAVWQVFFWYAYPAELGIEALSAVRQLPFL